MSTTLSGLTVAILATDGVEQVELTGPRDALIEAGATVRLVSLADGDIQAYDNDVEPADSFPVDDVVETVSSNDFDALVLPGGTTNPDKLRQDAGAVEFVKGFFDSRKPVGVICHGPWTLIEAGVVKGRTLTSFPSVRTDLKNAGATTVDEEVVRDGNLVSSRNPDDLPAFCAKLVEVFAEVSVRT